MHNFVVHSNESACRKCGRLGLEQVNITEIRDLPEGVYTRDSRKLTT